jgi:hypothetical protein
MSEKEFVKVKVNPKIVKAGRGFHDFYSKTDIYTKDVNQVFEVQLTPFIKKKLATGELLYSAEIILKSDDKTKKSK